mmetsp:Transcript_43476/g.90698  ORF Transcript_43476/g.90698 Transcript_43476/m.90698 type:complete len:460 (-) Transcript_43476:346-1725(-)
MSPSTPHAIISYHGGKLHGALCVFLTMLFCNVVAPSTFQTLQRDSPADASRKYSVQLMTGALPEKSKQRSSVVMTKRDGKKYRCYLPAATNGTTANSSSDVDASLSVSTLLYSLKDLCFYRMEGWWTYEYCFMKSIRQFHQEKSKAGAGKGEAAAVTQDYRLGTYWMPDESLEEATDGDAGSPSDDVTSNSGPDLANFRGEMLEDQKTRRKLWRQSYGNGTHCDVTGSPRESEVRFQCAVNEPSHLASIEEVSTCRYVVQFRTSLLCPHPAFDAEKKEAKVELIQCEPLGASGHALQAGQAAGAAATQPANAGGAADSPAEGADASDVQENAALFSKAKENPKAVAYSIGQCLLHRKYNYRGVIVGFDHVAQQSESWLRMMHVDQLQYGRDQPFYHVLPDVRDRPGAPVMYVAQENILPDSPSEPLRHPLIDEFFTGFDAETGRFTATPKAAETLKDIS